jgi:amino acid transporter
MPAFAANPNPFYVLAHALWGSGWWLIAFALVNSTIAGGLACTNAASRVMYTMGIAGTLPARFATIHPIHRTPTFAIAFAQVVGFIAVMLVGLLLSPADVFGFLGTISALAAIVLYAMANVALTSYMRREHRERFSMLTHVIVPGVGTLILLPVLVITLYPVPDWPANIAPYVFLGSLVVGYGYMRWLESRDSGALGRGAAMLMGDKDAASAGSHHGQ